MTSYIAIHSAAAKGLYCERPSGPLTGRVENLFHPRRDRWHEHFAFQEAYIKGLTPPGRATVEVLALILGFGELS